MKKLFIFLMIFVCFSFASCVQEEDTSATSSTESTSAISHSEETTESTSTTETAQTTKRTYGDDILYYQTEIRATEPLQTEIPELQEQFDRSLYLDAVPCKTIIEIGGKKDIPSRFVQEFESILGKSGLTRGCDFGYEPSAIERNIHKFPQFAVTAGDEIDLYCNDILQENIVIYMIPVEEAFTIYYSSYPYYKSLQEAYNTLPKGIYCAYIKTACYGDYLITGDGDPVYNSDGERKTEYCYLHLYFLLEFQ